MGVEKQGKWRMRGEKGMGDFVGKMLPAEVLADLLRGVAFRTLSHQGSARLHYCLHISKGSFGGECLIVSL